MLTPIGLSNQNQIFIILDVVPVKSQLLQLAQKYTVQGCISSESMATCINLTD